MVIHDLIFQFVGPLPDIGRPWIAVYTFQYGFLRVDDYVTETDRSLRLCTLIALNNNDSGWFWMR